MRTVEWDKGVVRMIDQRLLPGTFEIAEFTDYHEVARAIKEMYIRGAPAIGAAAGFGMALAAFQSAATARVTLLRDLEAAGDVLRQARPTAVNLFWAVDRLLRVAGDKDLAAVAGNEGRALDVPVLRYPAFRWQLDQLSLPDDRTARGGGRGGATRWNDQGQADHPSFVG